VASLMYCIGIRLEELNKTTENLRISVIWGQIRIGRLPNTCPEYCRWRNFLEIIFSTAHAFCKRGSVITIWLT